MKIVRKHDEKTVTYSIKASVMDRNSLQRDFNPKRRLYASQEDQAYFTKTTEKAIPRLEISADFDRLKRKVKKHIIREVMTEYASDYGFREDVEPPEKSCVV